MLLLSATVCVFLLGRVASPTPKFQPGGPGGHSLSGLYPLNFLAWVEVALPGVQDSRQHSSRGH